MVSASLSRQLPLNIYGKSRLAVTIPDKSCPVDAAFALVLRFLRVIAVVGVGVMSCFGASILNMDDPKAVSGMLLAAQGTVCGL